MKRIVILLAIWFANAPVFAAGFVKKPATESATQSDATAPQKAEASSTAKPETKEEAKPAAPAEAPAQEVSKPQKKQSGKPKSSATLTEADRVWLRKAANVIGKAN